MPGARTQVALRLLPGTSGEGELQRLKRGLNECGSDGGLGMEAFDQSSVYAVTRLPGPAWPGSTTLEIRVAATCGAHRRASTRLFPRVGSGTYLAVGRGLSERDSDITQPDVFRERQG